YVVQWRLVGSDTHPARGRILFSVGRRSTPRVGGSDTTAPLGLALSALGRLLHFAGYALAFGLAALGVRGRRVAAGIGLPGAAEPVALLGTTASVAPAAPLDSSLVADVLGSSFGREAGLR